MAENKKHRYRKYVLILWGLFIIGSLFVVILFTKISNGKLGFMPSFEELENPQINLATQVISEDGEVLGKFYIGNENRTNVNFNDISPYMIDALVAIEDKRFYDHSGIDFRGLMRVLVKSILLGQDTGGGSTITQQLAKNLFPRETYSNPIKFAVRKFREWVIAIKLEKSFTKQEIIALYLNKYDFLYSAVGIESAARVYFNTRPNNLKVEEAALLAAMAKNPNLYNYKRNPELAVERRNLVLSMMTAQGYLDANIRDSLVLIPPQLDYQRVDHKLGMATYFREWLRNTMQENRPGDPEWEQDPLRGWLNKNFKPDGSKYDLYRDGLKIYTTINSRMQKYAEEAVKEHIGTDLQPSFEREFRNLRNAPFDNEYTNAQVRESMNLTRGWSERYRVHRLQGLSNDSIQKLFDTPVEMTVFSWNDPAGIDTVMSPNDSIIYYKKLLRAGFLAVDPHTGYTKAYVGGIDYQYFQYDQIMQGRRQVGSIFKPFVYTLAMQHGYSPCYEVANAPTSFEYLKPNGTPDTYTPKFSHVDEWEGQMITLKQGLSKSMNQISAWVIKQFNPEAVIDLVRKMGVKSPIDPVWPICVGAVELPVYEVVGAFTTFANKGIWIQPIMVNRIEDKNGNVISTFKPKEEEAISEEAAYKMLNMMEAVTQYPGTGVRLRAKYGFKNPIAGKTGTTNDNADGWFVGIVPNLVAGAWAGAEEQRIRIQSDLVGQGANMALPMWAIFMEKVYADSTLNISQGEFAPPLNFNLDLNCDAARRLNAKKQTGDDFDDDF
jgi:penicillin-binding protein 1A